MNRKHASPPAGRKRARAAPGPEEAARRWQQAVTAYREGELERARRAVAPLIDMQGAAGEVPLLAGLVEAQLGRPERARELLERGLRLCPHRLEGWLGLGNVLLLLGNPVDASGAYQKVLKREPRNVAALENLAVAFEDRWRLVDALDCYERLLAVDPSHDRALRGRAKVLVQLRRTDEARDAYRDLLRHRPDDPGLALDLADLLERANRPDEAEQYIPAVDSLTDPGHVAASRSLEAQLMIRRGELEAGLRLLEQARGETGCDTLSYREGAVLDRLGRVDEAMGAFARANAARARELRFRRLRRSDLGDYLEAKLARGIESARNGPAPQPAEATPVFLVGLPRSGTTLLDRMLGAHPQIQVFEEIEGVRAAEMELDAGADPEQARAAYWEHMRRRVDVDAGRLAIDKHPMNAMNLDVIRRIFPGARVIFALRHPYDSALSCYMQDFVANVANVHFLELDSTARFCAALLELMRRFEAGEPEHVIRVRYEDLVADHRAEVTRVLRAIGLDWDERIEDYAARAADSGLIGTASYEQVTRGLYASAVERWRRYENWLGPFRAHLGPLLPAFGYHESESG